MPAGRDAAGARDRAAAGGERVQLCTFRVGGEEYALDIMRVREIIPPLPVTTVPRAPSFVEGVARLRGDVLPVVDVRKRFGLAPTPPTRRTRFLVVMVGRRRIALVVDEVCEVLRVSRAELGPAPALVGQDAPPFFVGVCGGGDRRGGAGRIRLLLDVKALLDPSFPGERQAARAQVAAAGRA
jgi:purine-binding chemotaxis protein CheW